MLAISDTGSGMDAATRARIFEPFFTTKGPGRGTGLGLATVYAIVSQCRGHIEFESDASHGTTFALCFPREELPSTSPEPQRSNMPAGSGESILLVEDEHAVRRLTRRLLERGGYRVFDAEDGVAALAAAASLPNLDLLLTDITMPRLDGVALAEALRAKNPRLKVLLMSGYPTTESVGRAPSELRHSLLPKPFTQEQLLTRVRTALDEAI
jgi:CheY-like chemotaxis protein